MLLGVAFTSADIIYQKFLELHSTLSEKQIFQHKFSIFNILTRPSPPLHPLNGQKRDKGFS